jgi:hypothetical protein
LCQGLIVLEDEYRDIVFHSHAQTGTDRTHLHEGFLLGLVVDGQS